MGKGTQISPLIASIIVVIVLVVVGAVAFRLAGPRGKTEIPPERAREIQKRLTGGAGGNAGPPRGVSGIPPGLAGGR